MQFLEPFLLCTASAHFVDLSRTDGLVFDEKTDWRNDQLAGWRTDGMTNWRADGLKDWRTDADGLTDLRNDIAEVTQSRL